MADVGSGHRLVLELARSVTARRDLEDVLSATFDGLRRILPFGGGSIQLLDDEGWIRMAATEPAAPADVLALRIPLGSTVGGRVILTERPVYIADVLADPAVPAERRQANVSPGGVRSYLGVPLMADGHAIGLIQVDSPDPDAWSDEQRLLLLHIGPIVGAAIQNAKAYALHAEAARRTEQLEERQEQVDQAVVSLLQNDIATVRSLAMGASAANDADLRGRLSLMTSQIDQLQAVLRALLSPAGAAKLAESAEQVPRARTPRQRSGYDAPTPARQIDLDQAVPTLPKAL
ncbi:MAG: two-component system, NtrC family, sensor kinase [Frankiales bacterium]|nr:two-component system, NtrC family, sensor kinase [Frankiales bacterium]